MKACSHRGTPVPIGPYTMFAGGRRYDQGMVGKYLAQMDVIVCLTENVPAALQSDPRLVHYPITDMSGMPDDFPFFLRDTLIPALQAGKKIFVFCFAGHGRTGTIFAGLKALLEPDTEDPVDALREQYCCEAVETDQQIVDVFALRVKPVPEKYTADREDGENK